MSPHQNAQENRNVKTDNKSFESETNFKYLWMALTRQNFVYKEVKGGSVWWMFGYRSVYGLHTSYLNT